MKLLGMIISLSLVVLVVHLREVRSVKFQEVISVVEQRRQELSEHQFIKTIKNESIPLEKRMSFVPYWTFYAMTAADILDSWIRIDNPKTKLEERINAFVEEDNFHYNFFLNDVEKVLGYTLDRFGSYAAVLRHIWGDDSKAVRQLQYSWAACAKKYDDPMVVLATFEAIEAGLKDSFEAAYNYFYKPDSEDEGLKSLKYFGRAHVELEMNHTVTAWFKDGEQPYRPLADYEVSEETLQHSLEVVKEIMDR